ncbi:MAG TPA: hypothetical protein VM557_11280 [Thermoanaerobaculia bacterium]|nr:hypothetical protein [Thermoanaerobaculia bacterium]
MTIEHELVGASRAGGGHSEAARASRAEYEVTSRPKNLSREDRCRVLWRVQTRSYDASAPEQEPDDGQRILRFFGRKANPLSTSFFREASE